MQDGHDEVRTICVCIDDYGLTAGINEAAVRLNEQDRVNAISCMVGAPRFQAGAGDLRRLALHHAVDVGLHLDLTQWPMLARSRRSLRGLIVDSLLGRLDRLGLRMEIRSQFDAFEQTMGCAPAYVDGHQHVHQLPGVRDTLLDELERRNSTVKPWLRSTRAPTIGGWRVRAKPTLIELLGNRALTEAAQRRGYSHNSHLLGVYNFQASARAYAQHLARWLDAAVSADLLLCHASAGRGADDPIAQARLVEFEVLGGQQFADLLAERQIVLQPMSRLLARGR